MHSVSTWWTKNLELVKGTMLCMRRRLTVKHSLWRTSILFTLVTAVIFGLGYPLLMTGLAHVIFPRQAAGSLITRNAAGHRLRADRAELHLRQVLPSAPIGCGQRLRRDFFWRHEPCAIQRQAAAAHAGRYRQAGHAENPGKPVPIDMVTYFSARVSILTSRLTMPISRRRASPRRAD